VIIVLDETQVVSDADSDLSDHEDFLLSGEDHHIKMEVSVTKKEQIKQLFYSSQVLSYIVLSSARCSTGMQFK